MRLGNGAGSSGREGASLVVARGGRLDCVFVVGA